MDSSNTIRHAYTSEYYLTDCGGYQQYRETGGKRLTDERPIGVAAIAGLRTCGRVLDLGCGRGELAYYFAGLGHAVTAVDYSQDAIRLAEQTFVGDPELRSRVELLCESVSSLRLRGEYEVVVASDVVEHLLPDELDRMYRDVFEHLSQTGIFVVHTYPNLWYFQYDYARKRRRRDGRDEVLPEQPRTEYELLMHINEQNPRTMRRQLAAHFPHVRLWFGEPSNMGGSLLRHFSHRELAGARDLYAIASRRPVDENVLRGRLESRPLQPVWLRELRLIATMSGGCVMPAAQFDVQVEIDNRTPVSLGSLPPDPVSVSYRWLLSDGKEVEPNGIRTAIRPPIAPGCRRSLSVQVAAPPQPGSYILRLTLVQEWIQWFDTPPIGVYCDLPMEVGDQPSGEASDERPAS
jgi:2-polyprenyl-3-methyl-5-hydroxy-6-metoxy-1,4-benzoquinol methylase